MAQGIVTKAFIVSVFVIDIITSFSGGCGKRIHKKRYENLSFLPNRNVYSRHIFFA